MSNVGVVGLGLLGRGIASCLLAHGHNLIVYTLDPEEYAIAEGSIQASLQELIDREGFSQELAKEWRSQFIPASSLTKLASCEIVFESIVEDLSSKLTLYEQLEEILPEKTIIASNTSSIPIRSLQAGRKHPERIVGMHWAEPAHATRFLEIVRGEQTSQETIDAVSKLALALDKEPCVVAGDLPGFLANRLAYAMYREAFHLLREGIADAETIDRSFRNSVGLWASVCGPLRWIDLTGGPSLYASAMNGVLPTLAKDENAVEMLRGVLRTMGRGINDGEGFYTYTQQDAASWTKRFRENVWQEKAKQRPS